MQAHEHAGLERRPEAQVVSIEISLADGTLISGEAGYWHDTGEVVLAAEVEAEIDRRWNDPVTGAAAIIGGQVVPMICPEGVWIIAPELGHDGNSNGIGDDPCQGYVASAAICAS